MMALSILHHKKMNLKSLLRFLPLYLKRGHTAAFKEKIKIKAINEVVTGETGLNERGSIVWLSCAMPDYTKITICRWFPLRRSSHGKKKKEVAERNRDSDADKHRNEDQ